MTSYQKDRKEMHDDVLLFLDSNSDKYSAIPAIGKAKNLLTEINQKIEIAQVEQEKSKVNMGKTKKQVKKLIAEKADILNDILEDYAGVINNSELAQRMDASATDLFSIDNQTFALRIKEIIDEVTKYIDPVKSEYGVTDEQVEDLRLDLDHFESINNLPRSYQIASKVATSDMDELFKKANKVLEDQLDKRMKIFKRRDPAFYKGYLAARVVVNS
jgi:uncharacterized membrane-anchored protein YhcB (DUF1043 family)